MGKERQAENVLEERMREGNLGRKTKIYFQETKGSHKKLNPRRYTKTQSN